MHRRNILHLLSGGIDSVTLLYQLLREGHGVDCVIYDYKQRHANELLWAKHHARRCNVIYRTVELPELGGLCEPSWIVDNRNAVFLSVAVNIASSLGADTVTIGCNADDAAMFPDCTKKFFRAMNRAVEAAGYAIEIYAPYIELTKQQIIRKSKKYLINPKETYTCYLGGSEPCGKCPACIKMRKAMQ